ncbi:ribonucleoside-diphosphate reductase subunit alpha [Candidatus Azambacteria bacterium]|nr:ribonucleoside-diphosphate reductase subunit alpha [Candidatus Azambacteria bacterium]
MSTKIKRIRKRNGELADFDQRKISIAIKKAFDALQKTITDKELDDIVDNVINNLEKSFSAEVPPSVENVQDFVEKDLMSHGFYDVAKSYILYRYEHAKERERQKEEVIKKIEENDLYITKKSGKREKFSAKKLEKTLSYVISGYENVVDVNAIVKQCRLEFYDGISTDDIFKTLIMTTRSFIEQDPAYSFISAQLLLKNIYKEALGAEKSDFKDINKVYKEAFIKNIKEGVDAGKLDKRLLGFDLEKLSKKLEAKRDELLIYLGVQTLYDRYFVQNPETKRRIEAPQTLWMRVAMGLAINEKDKNEKAGQFYDIISTLRFMPSTPTLFHSGSQHPQLSSCYLNIVEDSLDHIFKVYADNAQLSKWSGGIGTDWTNLRATGAFIKGTGVESQGVIPFLKIANDVTVAINRSGRRRGATCAYLETWHMDIEDFLELRKNTGDERRRTHDMNTANWIPDLFMKRVKADGDWTLFSPEETPDLHHIYGKEFDKRYEEYERFVGDGKIKMFKKIKARDLWKKMLAMLFETGHPWITFKDPSNIRSPQDHVGVVHNSNLCTEITLNTSAEETAVCNLGSLNFPMHMKDGKLDETMVKETVSLAMRMLDNVIDINFYPTKEAKISNLKHRPVGLGVMGFQDALYMMNATFDSDACVLFADTSMEMISYYAILASSELAKERGAYETFKGSKWEKGIFPLDTLDLLEKERGIKIDVPRSSTMDWQSLKKQVKENGMRNSNCMAIAPTATISNICGSVPTIEPIYKNIYVKSNASGDFIVINPYLVDDLKKLNLWDYEMLGKIKYYDGSVKNIPEIPDELKEKYKEVFEIEPEWLIKSAAYRGKWVDQSQSLNIYFHGSSGQKLSEVYLYAWDMGLKTTYYLRTLAISQVEKSTVSTAKFGSTHIRQEAKPVPAKAEIKEERPRVEFAVAKTTQAESAKQPKLCKILDPDCESCQ